MVLAPFNPIKSVYILITYLAFALPLSAQPIVQNSLNSKLQFTGDHIVYKGEKIELGKNAFYIDAQIDQKVAHQNPYVFQSVNEAALHLTNGSESNPMTLYIAPYVYWIDNPDNPEIRIPKVVGSTPFGLEIECEWLKFFGLSDDPRDVVLACNRGQTMGAKGNFTMLNITGDGTCAENITFGNYCNIDLEYPLKPELNRAKRGSAIVQAQLVFCHGDKLLARNTRFVSRLNLCPFIGGKRTLFDRCHFESTDDALATAIYLNCTLDFYASKPFGHTTGTGAIFINCDLQSFVRGEQYFTKGPGQVAAIDTRMKTEMANYLGWREEPAKESRNYQFNVSMNNEPIQIGTHHPNSTVDMTDKKVLDAYVFDYHGKSIYNTYNLLRGNDDWDPMGIKEQVLAAEKEKGTSLTNLAMQLRISPTRVKLETGKDSIILSAKAFRYGNYELSGENVEWKVAPDFASFVSIKTNIGNTCTVIPTNESDTPTEVVISASTANGLQAASILYILPKILEAPAFTKLPVISKLSEGKLSVDYTLDMKYPDQSLVSWYRCSDAKGTDPIEISVSRMDEPKLHYELTQGDIGYYIMATVAPKHQRCHAGKAIPTIYQNKIRTEDVQPASTMLVVDFKSMSAKYQPQVLPGFWTLECFAPADTHEHDWEADNSKDPWYYGTGEGGAANDTGFVQASKGARMRYTPVGNQFGDMRISFTAVPAKTAGQGFSSARAQYMDVFIKFDTKNLNGYALRLIRTTKFSDAIDFQIMKYENGIAKPLGEAVSASCYRPNCTITLETKGSQLIVHAENLFEYYTENDPSKVVKIVDMKAEITANGNGGFGFQHTGTVGSGATLIKDLKVEWY